MTTPMILLSLLVAPLAGPLLVERFAGRPPLGRGTAAVLGLAPVFAFTGVGHFAMTDSMARMLPPWVPARVPLVYLTGAPELAAAAGLLVPRWRRTVGLALTLMLVLFLPVNVYAAFERIPMGGHAWGPVYLWIRVPLQLVLLVWTWRFAVRRAA